MIIMTDSVEEDPQIENVIATLLGSNHIPLHLLCKAHTVEALDISNINVLANLESSFKFREAPESIHACAKSFIRSEKSVVLYTIKSVHNFASYDKSSSSTNQGELFDYVLQRENKIKHLSLYQERHFTKLGHSCASVLDAMPYIQMVLMMLTRHFLLMRRNCNVGRFVWHCGMKLEPKLGILTTAFKCSVMSWCSVSWWVLSDTAYPQSHQNI